jgi:DNA repair photolyase
MMQCKKCKQMGTTCSTGTYCERIPAKNRSFCGIRHTSDGFDCALPITIDSHTVCAYECLYCFSDNLVGHEKDITKRAVGQTSLKKIEAVFSGAPGRFNELCRQALRYDKRNAQGYPCAVQVGGLCDPVDHIELQRGWLLRFMDICIKYNQPARISTKGALFLLPEYINKIKQAPHLFWVAFSIISAEDDVMRKVDRHAPLPSKRLEAMRAVTAAGANASLRLRPMIKGITDRNGNYKDLIRRSADAGARAVSAEVLFYPLGIPKDKRWKWRLLDKYCGYSLKEQYRKFGRLQACTRPSYLWTENIMHSVRNVAHSSRMVLGVSDPVWKQLTDVGCCCGIPPNDPVFGNWEPENATEALRRGRDEGGEICFADICPPWASSKRLSEMINLGAGPKTLYAKRHDTWSDKLREIWNDPSSERGPMNYFQGALRIVGTDSDGNLIYKYKGLKRQHRKTGWNVPEE